MRSTRIKWFVRKTIDRWHCNFAIYANDSVSQVLNMQIMHGNSMKLYNKQYTSSHNLQLVAVVTLWLYIHVQEYTYMNPTWFSNESHFQL